VPQPLAQFFQDLLDCAFELGAGNGHVSRLQPNCEAPGVRTLRADRSRP
jgi:hypothetical protein